MAGVCALHSTEIVVAPGDTTGTLGLAGALGSSPGPQADRRPPAKGLGQLLLHQGASYQMGAKWNLLQHRRGSCVPKTMDHLWPGEGSYVLSGSRGWWFQYRDNRSKLSLGCCCI